MISMQISEFMADLDSLIFQQKQDYDKIPYVNFLEHFKDKPVWTQHILNIESPFMKLLQLENLFFFKTMISQEQKKWIIENDSLNKPITPMSITSKSPLNF